MSDIYFVDEEEAARNAVKAGLMLAKARYDAKFAKFVRKNASRLSFIEDELTIIAQECAAQVDADPIKVETYLRAAIADEIAVTPHEHGDVVNDGAARGEIHAPNTDTVEPAEGQQTIDIKDAEGSGAEIENHDARIDLNDDSGKFGGAVRAYAGAEVGNAADESTWKSCFRCEQPLNPVVASVTPICPTCTILVTALNDEAAPAAEPAAGGPPEMDGPLEQLQPVQNKALEIVSLSDGSVAETIPLPKSDPNYIAQVTLGLYTKMDRDKFFIREVDMPHSDPSGLDIGEDEEVYEVEPLVDPVPPIKTPSPERTPAPEREPVKTHTTEAGIPVNPNEMQRCEMCSFTGTAPQVQLHELQAHPELAQRAQQMQQLQTTPGIAPAALPGAAPASTAYSAIPGAELAVGSAAAVALVALLAKRFGIKIPESEAEALLHEAEGHAPDGHHFQDEAPAEEETPRSGSFNVVAKFDNLQDLHEWEKNAGRGN